MAYRKHYGPKTIPVLCEDAAAQDELLVWLMRESFDRVAAGDALTIVEFVDLGEAPADTIPPKAEKQLGRPATDYAWRMFEAIGERPPAWMPPPNGGVAEPE